MFRSKKFNVRLYTCNYGEAGNILRRKMYKVRKCVSECKYFFLPIKYFLRSGLRATTAPAGLRALTSTPGCAARTRTTRPTTT